MLNAKEEKKAEENFRLMQSRVFTDWQMLFSIRGRSRGELNTVSSRTFLFKFPRNGAATRLKYWI